MRPDRWNIHYIRNAPGTQPRPGRRDGAQILSSATFIAEVRDRASRLMAGSLALPERWPFRRALGGGAACGAMGYPRGCTSFFRDIPGRDDGFETLRGDGTHVQAGTTCEPSPAARLAEVGDRLGRSRQGPAAVRPGWLGRSPAHRGLRPRAPGRAEGSGIEPADADPDPGRYPAVPGLGRVPPEGQSADDPGAVGLGRRGGPAARVAAPGPPRSGEATGPDRSGGRPSEVGSHVGRLARWVS